MVRKIFMGLLLMGLAGLAQAAPVYIEFPGIPGESSAEGHKNWIEINSFSPSFSPTMTHGGKGTLKLTKRQDRTSAKLAQASAMGTVYPIITMDVPVTGEPTGYMRVVLKDVLCRPSRPAARRRWVSFNVCQKVPAIAAGAPVMR